MVDAEQFVAQFDQFGLGEGGSVSRCDVMMEEHFFLRQKGAVFSAIRRRIGPIIWHSTAL